MIFRGLTYAEPYVRHRRDQHSIEYVYEIRLYEKGKDEYMCEYMEMGYGLFREKKTALQNPRGPSR